ncbi:hypothetical protein GCM10027018_22920 [Paenibacillus thermoaerophilus]
MYAYANGVLPALTAASRRRRQRPGWRYGSVPFDKTRVNVFLQKKWPSRDKFQQTSK